MSDVTILDGGMAKELRRIGAPFRQPEWSALALIEAPEMVVQVHRSFIDAGAQVITTNNYAVVPYHLADAVVAERLTELTDLAGRLAREAADGAPHEVLVAGSLPPLFGSYEPQRFDAERAAPLYAEIVRALDPHVDLWLAETMSSTAEMLTIADAIRSDGSGQPVWMAFSLRESWSAEPDRQDDHGALRSGETSSDIVAAVARAAVPIDALMFNCSSPEYTGPAIASLAGAVDGHGLDVRIGGYANAFPTERDHDYEANEVVFERREEITADRYASDVAGWIRDGATIVGGCCDMYPEHIAELARRFG